MEKTLWFCRQDQTGNFVTSSIEPYQFETLSQDQVFSDAFDALKSSDVFMMRQQEGQILATFSYDRDKAEATFLKYKKTN